MTTESFLNRQIREYIFNEIIGVGGMGAVFKCHHVYLKTQRAVKVLRPDLTQDPTFKARFEKEARILAQLENPYLIRVYEFFEEEGYLFLVMEYVCGESLADRMEFLGSLPIEKMIQIIIQVCEGLAHAHAQGIVHRDLSPDNILLTSRPEGGESVKIIDFGIAKSVFGEMENNPQTAGLTTPGIFIGKVRYCSPEQASGKELDHRSDQYSLALILYEAVTGKPAFQGETLMESLTQRLVKTPQKLRQVMEGRTFPRELESILVRALEINPANRYDNITGFRDALKSVLEGTSVQQDLGLQTEKQPVIDFDKTAVKIEKFPEIERPAKPQSVAVRIPGLTSIAEDLDAVSRQAGSHRTSGTSRSHALKHLDESPSKPIPPKKWPWILSIIVFWVASGLGIHVYFIKKTTFPEYFRKIGLLPDTPKNKGKTPMVPTPASKTLPTKLNNGKSDYYSKDVGPFLASSPGVIPPRIIRSSKAEVPPDFARSRLPVTVNVQVVVLKNGQVGSAEVMKAGIPSLDEAAIRTVRNWQFSHGTRSGQPADIIIDVPVVFEK